MSYIGSPKWVQMQRSANGLYIVKTVKTLFNVNISFETGKVYTSHKFKQTSNNISLSSIHSVCLPFFRLVSVLFLSLCHFCPAVSLILKFQFQPRNFA